MFNRYVKIIKILCSLSQHHSIFQLGGFIYILTFKLLLIYLYHKVTIKLLLTKNEFYLDKDTKRLIRMNKNSSQYDDNEYDADNDEDEHDYDYDYDDDDKKVEEEEQEEQEKEEEEDDVNRDDDDDDKEEDDNDCKDNNRVVYKSPDNNESEEEEEENSMLNFQILKSPERTILSKPKINSECCKGNKK